MKTKLGTITKSIFDGKHGDCKGQEGSGLFFISVKDLTEYDIDYSNAREITKEDFTTNYLRTNLENGDTLYVNTGDTIGKSVFVKNNPLVKQTSFQKSVAVIKPNTDFVDSRYLYYLLKYITPLLRKASAGSAQKNLLLSTLRDFDVDIHERNEQIRISSVLGAIDDKVRCNLAFCTELESMAKTLYDYWFTQFDFPNEEGKPYRSSGGAMEWNEQLKREIPKGWSVATINEMTKSYRGVSYDKKDLLPSSENGVLVLRGNNIQNNRLVYDNNVAYVPHSFVSKEQEIRAHDIILTMSSGSKDHIGKCTMFQCDSPHTYGAFLTKFTPDKDKVGFVYLSMISDFFKKKIKAICNGTGINNLTNETFDNLVFPKPVDSVLGCFEEIIAPMLEKMGICERENEELTKLRDWLLPMLMNGQATVE